MIKDKRVEYSVLILICIVLTILDNSIIPFFSIYKSYPSLLFTFAIAFSLVNTKGRSVFIGVTAGVLQDIFFFNGFGVNCLLNLLLCYLASYIGSGMIREKRSVPVIAMFFLTIIKYIGVFAIFYLLNMKAEFVRCIITAIYNSLVMLFIYKILANIYNDEYTRQQWRFK